MALLVAFVVFVKKYSSTIALKPAASPIAALTPAETVPEPISVAPKQKIRTLEIPTPPVDVVAAPAAQEPQIALTPSEKVRAEGRKKRESLPMGVVLWNNVPVYDGAQGTKKIFDMATADLVRVFPDGTGERLHIQPGLDIFLAATTKKVAPAGMNLPDRDGWVDKSKVHVFDPDEARAFLMELEPMTVGNDPNYSTVDFYDRAIKNSDPVIHRVIAPRLIALLELHDEYDVSSWAPLYRDRDSKIRDAALASLRERGVGKSRPMVDDLITRLAELTRTRATGETELEVLTVLRILNASGVPQVPVALQSFVESWKSTQSERLNKALADSLK